MYFNVFKFSGRLLELNFLKNYAAIDFNGFN